MTAAAAATAAPTTHAATASSSAAAQCVTNANAGQRAGESVGFWFSAEIDPLLTGFRTLRRPARVCAQVRDIRLRA